MNLRRAGETCKIFRALRTSFPQSEFFMTWRYFMKSWIRTGLLFTALSTSSYACFIPENQFYIPENFAGGGLTEVQFNNVIDKVSAHYSPIISAKGATLDMKRNWADGTVNAYASRDLSRGTTWTVAMFGGLARHPLITEDAFAVVVCHELGHHLGGAPKKTQAFQVDPKWASNEGESDYFATAKCLRKVFENEDNEKALAGKTIPAQVQKSCSDIYKNQAEALLCQRVAIAGLEIATFLGALSKDKTQVSFSTPDKKKVWRVDNDHPKAQCRLDTYFQGALCDKGPDLELGQKDPSIGACTAKNGDSAGLRPRCWMTRL